MENNQTFCIKNPFYNPNAIAVYIHWPFCLKKCPYCDFNSFVSNRIDYELWIECYFKSINNQYKFFKNKKISSIFFGGGTPSLMRPKDVKKLIDYFILHNEGTLIPEITLEANPSTFEIGLFNDFKQAGINRLSLGVQSFDNKNLKFLGRNHDAKEAVLAIENAKKIFDSISFDIIMGLSDQTLKEFSYELDQALELSQDHISIYQLTIEKKTPFYKKNIKPASEYISEKMYLMTLEKLATQGIYMYEISNFAKQGRESKHNLNYWQGGDYVGVGPGAHGRLLFNNQWIATKEEKSLSKYLKQSNDAITLNQEKLSNVQRMEELVINFLRLNMNIPQFIIEYLENEKIEQAINQGLIDFNNDEYVVSLKGRLCLNYLIYILLV